MSNTVSFLHDGKSKWAPAPVPWPRIGACLTWFEDEEGGAEPWAFLELFVKNILQVLPENTTVTAITLKRKFTGILTKYSEEVLGSEPFSMALATWKKNTQTDFPDRVEFRSVDGLVCVMETELWSQVGGPAPYHDSVTLAFYSKEWTADLILAATRSATSRCGANLKE